MEISKKYKPAEIEDKWYEAWLEAKAFKSVPDDREPYTVVIPPPNVTGILHMGHVLNNTIQDILVRRKRMQGYNACWVPGTDHASIATEAKVVKLLAEKGIDKRDIGREAFLEHAYAWKEKYGGIILHQLRKLGASCDWDRTSFTMDPEYSDSVIKVFCDLYEKGYIYRGIRMVNWDPQAQTAVSDEEVNYKATQGGLYHIRYPLAGEEGKFVTIATTRPETMLGDTAVAINPDDERYTALHGKRAIVPLLNREVPIITDDYVKTDFGTGCLKVTPAHDINDYELGIKHNLDSIDIFMDNGTISPAGELYVGMDRFAVRKQIVKDLEDGGFLVKQEPYEHEVGYSERTDAAIEPKLSMQWFMRMENISKPALKAVNDGEIKLIPEKFINTYRHWMENVRDWCLSRQLWWGHQIPAYYIKGGNEVVVAPNQEEALLKARAATNNPRLTLDDLEQDPDVLDTWASSWLWPISVFKGLTSPDQEDIEYYYPTNDLVTAPEILFFWVARMILAGYELKGEKPFSNVYLHGIVRDKQRRKMSKSLGNSPDPLDLIAQYGADGVRFGIMLSSPAGNDLLFDDSLVEQGRNFANKIWNAFRLINGWEISTKQQEKREEIAIEWMRSRIAQVAEEIEDHFSKFRLSDALMSIYKLIWSDYCSWFLEMIKPNYGEALAKETYQASKEFFEDLLMLLHPFMPFLSEEIWHHLGERKEGSFLATSALKSYKLFNQKALDEMAIIQESITAVRALRAEKGIANKEQIQLYINTDAKKLFQANASLLERFLNTEEISFIDENVEQAASVRVGTHEFFVPLGAVDVAAEIEKLEKEIKYMKGFLAKTEAKLSNERFVNNAPENVVALERKKKEDAEAKLAVLEESLARIS